MSTEREEDPPIAAEPFYLLIGFGGLLLQLLLLAWRDLAIVGLIASGLGTLGLLVRWRPAPFLVLVYLVIAFLIWPPRPSIFKQQGDLLQGAALLAYLLAQFRLFAIEEQAVPISADRPRIRGTPLKASERQQRPVTMGELVRGGFTVGGALVAAVALWAVLPEDPGPDSLFNYGAGWSQVFLLIWLFALGFLVFRTVLVVIAFWRMPLPEARLIVQDVAWQETRREQQRLQAWRQKGLRR